MAGTGDAHRLLNETSEDVLYLEVGDRTAGDEASYPDDDLVAREVDGSWQFFHKDGGRTEGRRNEGGLGSMTSEVIAAACIAVAECAA